MQVGSLAVHHVLCGFPFISPVAENYVQGLKRDIEPGDTRLSSPIRSGDSYFRMHPPFIMGSCNKKK